MKYMYKKSNNTEVTSTFSVVPIGNGVDTIIVKSEFQHVRIINEINKREYILKRTEKQGLQLT